VVQTPGGHVFDISLHGFPYGMVKSCRRYWGQQIADSIVPSSTSASTTRCSR